MGGVETQMIWKWDSATLVSLEELNARVESHQAQYDLVMPLQYGFYDSNDIPDYKDPIFLIPAWLPSLSSCPHLPTSQGRENMEFWIYESYGVTKGTLKQLEEACVVGLSGASDTSFRLPGFGVRFDARCWPATFPCLPKDGKVIWCPA